MDTILLHIIIGLPCITGFLIVWLFFLISLSFLKDISQQIDNIQESGME